MNRLTSAISRLIQKRQKRRWEAIGLPELLMLAEHFVKDLAARSQTKNHQAMSFISPTDPREETQKNTCTDITPRTKMIDLQ